MAVLSVDVGKMTGEELMTLEHTLRHILDRDKSQPGFDLAMAMKREMRERYEQTLTRTRSGSPRVPGSE